MGILIVGIVLDVLGLYFLVELPSSRTSNELVGGIMFFIVCLVVGVVLTVKGAKSLKRHGRHPCPFCKEMVLVGAVICPHCRKDLAQ
jgi:hypothetical protein